MDWIEEARSYLARCYSGVIEPPASLIKRGVEEVRSLRMENLELSAAKSCAESNSMAWQKRAEQYEQDRDAVRNKHKELEKENEILRCIKQSWINRAEEENAKAERLEKEKAELEKEANKRLWAINEIHAQNSRLRCQEAQNLRDKFAMAALQGLVGRPEVNDPELGIGMDELVDDAFRFAALCMEARKK